MSELTKGGRSKWRDSTFDKMAMTPVVAQTEGGRGGKGSRRIAESKMRIRRKYQPKPSSKGRGWRNFEEAILKRGKRENCHFV